MEDVLLPEDLFVAAGRDGYLHPSYAEAYLEPGEVRHLRRSGGRLISRAIPGGVTFPACREAGRPQRDGGRP